MSNSGELQWAQVDVFAERAYQGNMLAVFADGTGLTDAEMLALARETNLSETTFVLPGDAADEDANGVRVRIFTTEEELPFAGHPTLGTASWLWWNHPALKHAEEIKLRLNKGTVPVRFTAPADGEAGVFAEMEQGDATISAPVSRGAVAAALSLHVSDLHTRLQPRVVSTGLPFLVVGVQDVDALSRVAASASQEGLLRRIGAKFAYVVAPVAETTWRARMRMYGGIDDPATGSAAGCAIAALVSEGLVASQQRCIIEQGLEVHRPSRIHVRATRNGDGSVNQVFVGGRTIPVAKGSFQRP